MGDSLFRLKQHLYRFVFLFILVNLYSVSAQAQTFKIMAFGDSLSAGYNLPQGDGFPEQLEVRLKNEGFDVSVINAAVSGDTTSGGLSRLEWALGDQPDMVILELGGNDGLRGLDPALTKDNLGKMIETIQGRGIKVLLAGMLAPPNYGTEYTNAFREMYPELAKQYNVTLYPFFLDGVAGNPKLNLPDGIHPTKEGIAVIVEKILPYIKKVMKE